VLVSGSGAGFRSQDLDRPVRFWRNVTVVIPLFQYPSPHPDNLLAALAPTREGEPNMGVSHVGRNARAAGFIAVIVAAAVGLGALPAPAAGPVVDGRPNIVLITTDDMTDYDLQWMPQTKRLMRSRGFEFTEFLSPHPLCCPARAELMTGQYAHNNGVLSNKGSRGGSALRDRDNNVGRWLHDAGYQTAFVGKFFNQFDRVVPLGWDHFNYSMRGTYAPYDFNYSEEPRPIEDEYTADYVGRKTIDYVSEFKDKGPFFIWASHIAPHGMLVNGRWGPPVPADRHAGLYRTETPPFLAKPSFNERSVLDKPQHMRRARVSRDRMISLFRSRIRSLRAVDDQLGALLAELERTGERENTVILFTSDNGYLLGEHRLTEKNYLYEEALQVPMLLRGPGIPVGKTSEMATMVDVASTVADLAGLVPPRLQDGRSMLPITRGEPGHRRVLIQAGGETEGVEWLFRGVRDARWTYAEHHTGAAELYDRKTDPYELTNVSGKKPRVSARYAAMLDRLRDCSGASC
jgi:arylsulfatase A-like enzyme